MTFGKKPWWHPEIHAGRRTFLLARNRVVAAIREYLANLEFVEVDSAALQVSPGNEAHLHAFATNLVDNLGQAQLRYLHTSPEFACKKLLAAGERKIFYMGHVCRNRERTSTHLPEFTMLEWYRADEPYAKIINDALGIIAVAASMAGVDNLSYRGRVADVQTAAEILSVAEAFSKYANVDILGTITESKGVDRDALARQAPIPVAPGDSWSDIFSLILVNLIEPHLGHGRITVLCDYPAHEAALSRISSSDPRIAERFEIYACGVELVNGFGELTDAAEQRRRFVADMDLKESRYGERYPLDEDFLEALKLMPEAAGAALGLDRLIMLATGAPTIDHVVWTPPD